MSGSALRSRVQSASEQRQHRTFPRLQEADVRPRVAIVDAGASVGSDILAHRKEGTRLALGPRPGFGLLLATAVLSAAPAWGAGLSEAQVGAFVARQERAWNAGALDLYFSTFRPDAVFTDQYRTPAGQLVPYGSSTVAEARAQSRKFLAASDVSERGEIVRIALGSDGHTAQVVSRVVSRIQGPKGLRITCAERRQEVVLASGELRSKGQTDTFSRCPR